MTRMSFSDATSPGPRKRTRHERVLAVIEPAAPGAGLLALITPKAGHRRPPLTPAPLPRLGLTRNGLALSAQATEEARHEVSASRRFATPPLSRGGILAGTTIMNVRMG